MADEESPTYPVDIGMYQDTGFQGYEPEGVKTFQPQKKPQGKELTPDQKEQNRLISSIRIVIEHIIAGVPVQVVKTGLTPQIAPSDRWREAEMVQLHPAGPLRTPL
jgi:DDE superfamily endonuclease